MNIILVFEQITSLFSVVKTKVPISCAITAELICAFVLTYAKSRFSHDTEIRLVIKLYLIIIKRFFDDY